jgi:selenocysteine lyase/cysteine desulfurase
VKDFDYLSTDDIYVDTACQMLRPQQVIDAMTTYYHEYNACGGRVKYAWGRKVDEQVDDTRRRVLALLGKSPKDYVASFTLNTTYGINLLLGQLPAGAYAQLVTSEIEHNSVFLPVITNAKRLGITHKVLQRNLDGTLLYAMGDLKKSVVVLNSTSNIDGRQLRSAKQLAADVHKNGGRLIVDAAQTMAHHPEILKGVDFDAVCFSSHKMYGPSLGVIVAKKEFLKTLDYKFIGGGTVSDVTSVDNYALLHEEPYAILEPGLQDFTGIIGLGAAIDWQAQFKPEGQNPHEHQTALSQKLFDALSQIPAVTLINQAPSPIISFYSDKIDAHRLAVYLSAQHIMARSGYFCCHYYLSAVKHYPPLLRLSVGLHNTSAQIDTLIATITQLIGKA